MTVIVDGLDHATVTTDANGEFGMGGLPPGEHEVRVTKEGFIAKQVNATVEAGVQTPDLVEIMLLAVPTDSSYVLPFIWDGMVTCGTTFQNWCAAINLASGVDLFPDESFRFLFDEFMAQERTPDFLQVEVIWEPNNEFSQWAYGAFWASTWEEWEECLCTPNILATETGSGYILVQVPREAMEEFDVGFSTGIGVGFSAGEGLTAYEDVAEHPDRATVMVNQPFEAYMHAFYGCVPDPDWRFTETETDPVCDPDSLKDGASA